MFKSFVKTLFAEIKDRKTQKVLKEDIVAPILSYIMKIVAPYFIILCVLLLIIILLLIKIIFFKGGI